MRILYFSNTVTVLVDFISWFIIHMAVSIIAFKIPDKYFAEDKYIYRAKKWENEGEFYIKYLKIKKWKKFLPDGAKIFRMGFLKKNIASKKSEYFKKFIIESRRAEFTHWLAMPPAILFFLWNNFYAGLFMILYAVLANLPCIVAQRYNRPRFENLLNKEKRRNF